MPAAVISSGKNRPNAAAATSAALYPATLACELSASIACARDRVRGRPSRLIAVTPWAASAAARSGSVSGAEHADDGLARAEPADRAADGLVTVRTTSAAASSSAAPTMVAPASA